MEKSGRAYARSSRDVIVHVYGDMHPHEGGPPQVIVHLARAQLERGCDVRLIAMNGEDHDVIDFVKDELEEGEDLPIFSFRPRGIRALWSRSVIHKALCGATTVHIHSIWPTNNLYVAHYCLSRSIPYVLSIHGHLRPKALAIKSFKKRLGLLLGYRAMVKGASAVHALTASEALDARNFGIQAPITVIPNGIHSERFNTPPSRSLIEGYVPSLKGKDYLLFLSRIHPPKGARRLTEAFKELSSEFPDLHLVVAGPDFGGVEEVKAEIGTGELGKRLHLPGFLSGDLKASALAHAQVFCLPSDHEGFSVAILEALAWGAPTVISTGCHFPELAEAGAGWVHGLSTAELTTTLREVLSSNTERTKKSGFGKKWVSEHYSWVEIEKMYQRLYDSVKTDHSRADEEKRS